MATWETIKNPEVSAIIIFSVENPVPVDELSHCISIALTYRVCRKHAGVKQHFETTPR